MVIVEQLGIALVVLFVGIQAYFFYKKSQYKKAKEEMLKEINKMFALVNTRNMLVAEELKELIDWVNMEFPVELSAIFVSELHSKSLAAGPEQERISKVVVQIANLVQNRIENIFERVAKKTQENFKIEE